MREDLWTTEVAAAAKKKMRKRLVVAGVVFAETNGGIRAVVVIIFLRSVAAFSSWCVFPAILLRRKRTLRYRCAAGRRLGKITAERIDPVSFRKRNQQGEKVFISGQDRQIRGWSRSKKNRRISAII